MAIYPNVLNEYKHIILDSVRFDDVIDELISKDIVDEKQYLDIWSRPNQIQHVVNFILQDAFRCKIFIDILSDIPQIGETVKAIKNDIDLIRRVIIAGEFPDFPLNYVVRNSVADVVKRQALKLEFGITSVLVIHGAPGFGKSYLVNQVLQTKALVNFSGEAMFWVNLGEYQNTTNIIYALWKLYLNIAKLSDKAALQHCPSDVSVLTTELRKLLQEQQLKNAILILDDVKSSKILDVFRINSKLIVTTQDKDVATASTANFIPITTGFTQKESIELLCKSLETKIDFVKEAGDIHRSCSGCPMLVNIIGSILKDSKDEALASADLWNEIIQEISHTYSLNDPTTGKVMCMIQKCVDRLSDEIKQFFLSLAVFSQHVNIKTVILMKLWNLPNRRVRLIMQTLEHKSLVVSFYNSESKSYVYSIHSLVFTYLVNNQPGDIRQYHIKLISLYDDINNQTPFDDPISQYILGYYGFHAKHAEMYEKFEEYFKLEFIERKIKYVGSADLLTDYTIYKDLITRKDPIAEEKLEGLKKLTSAYSSHLHTSPETNIIQYVIMFEHSIADVYSEAHRIATQNYNRLYFKLHDYSGKQKNCSILKNRNNVTTVIFLRGKEILVGSETGDIEIIVFDQYDQKANKFEGHTNTILSLIPSPDYTKFLSISNDQTTKLWKFERDLDPQSPKCKQFDWRNMHSPSDDTENITFKMEDTDFILSAAFPHDNTSEIVTGSCKGKLIRWDTVHGTRIREMPERGICIPCILYTHLSDQIMFCCNGKIFRYTRRDFEYKGQLGAMDCYKQLHLMPGSLAHAVAVSKNSFEVWDYLVKLRISAVVFDANIVASIVNGQFLVLGTSDYKIHLYNFENRSMQRLENEFGLPNTLFLAPENYVAFIHVDGKVLMRHELSLKPLDTPIVQNVALFTSFWKDDSLFYALVKNQKTIDIYSDANLLNTTTIGEPITLISFCNDGEILILGTALGHIYLYSLNDGNIFRMLKVFDSEIVDVIYHHQEIKFALHAIACRNEIFIWNTQDRIPLLQNYYTSYHYFNYIIAVEDRSRILLINTSVRKSYEWLKDCQISASAFNTDRVLLALCYKEKNCHVLNVLKLDLENDLPKIKTYPQVEIDVQPNCLCFSFDGQLVAVGRADGVIEVLYVEAINHEIKKRAILSLHKSVEKLLFAPYGDPILVSVGDQVAWWNLSTFESSARETNDEGVTDLKKTVRQLSLMNIDWKNKKVIETVPYLLNSTNLYGRALKYISTSKDFKYFLIVDSHGSIFKMDLLT